MDCRIAAIFLIVILYSFPLLSQPESETQTAGREGDKVSMNSLNKQDKDNGVITDKGEGSPVKKIKKKDKKKDKKKTKKWKIKPPRLHGYIQAFYRYAFETGTDGIVDNDNFRVQRVRLKVDGKVLPRVSYEIDIDPRPPQITGILRDAYIGLDFIPNQQIRIGQQKMPFGYENSVSSSRLFAVNRTELSDNISRGQNLRDIGLGIKGKIPLSKKWRLEDHLAVSNGAGMNVQDDNTDKMNFWGRIGIRYKKDDFRAGFGASFGTGDFIDSAEYIDFNRLGCDFELDAKWLFMSTEFAMALDSVAEGGVGETDEIPAFYVNLVGKTPIPIGPIFRMDLLSDEYRRWLFGAYYGRASDRFRVLVNYEFREIFEDDAGNLGRGDDKFYVWAQVRF